VLTIPGNLKSRAKMRWHAWCNAWKITRNDGQIFRFTDLDRRFAYGGQFFTPIGGFNASAKQRELGLTETNVDFTGAISGSAWTFDDLRAGKWREAQVLEYIFDWRYPFAGPIRTTKYWIVRTEFDGETWNADAEGLTRWLRQKRGQVRSRNCDWFLGRDDDGILSTTSGRGCRYDVVGATKFNLEVQSIGTQRLTFDVVGSLAEATGFFDQGRVYWVDGNNEALETAVKAYTNPRTFSLVMELPFDITVGDHLHVEPGCDGTYATCQNTFSNTDNFGGRHLMPGADGMLRVPEKKGQ
jgi:uncharacterized phage protein (TIGR02218 family)